MVKKAILTIVLCISITLIGSIQAQTPERVAYVNSTELLEFIPEKVAASKAISELNKKYKDELVLMQNDYNKKYTDFITYQNSMAESIKLRRMQELHELEQNINEFMKVAQEDVDSQEILLIEPLRKKVKEAIEQVGVEGDFICVYDIANPSIAFVTPKAIDITPIVKQKLGLKK